VWLLRLEHCSRSVALVHPSLPSQSGIAGPLWSWVKPRIYDHVEWNPSGYNLTDNAGCEIFFVVMFLENEDAIDTTIEDATRTKLLQVPMESTEKPKYMKKCFKQKDEHGLLEWLIAQDKNNLVSPL